jgi:hypothetical protein
LAALGAVVVVSTAVVVILRDGGSPAASSTSPQTVNSTGTAATAAATTTATTATATTTAEATGDAYSQATAVDRLLDASSATRTKLNAAIDQVERCTGIAGAVTAFEQVEAERSDQVAQAQRFRVDALPDGESMRGALVAALRHSLEADQYFTAWARAVDGCRRAAPHNADYSRGRAASDQAGAAKVQFLALWNPTASRLGISTRSRNDI